MKKSIVRWFIYFLLFLLVKNTLFHLYNQTNKIRSTCTEISLLDSTNWDYHHARAWESTFQNYCMDYEVSGVQFDQSGSKRHQLKSPRGYETYAGYWGDLYTQLAENDQAYLDFISDSLAVVAAERGVTGNSFAEMVVTFVQDIPYSYIQTEPCDPNITSGKPCMDNVEYGIISPIEFLYTLQGDCDTRAVLLHVLLKRFGFDSRIVVSREYGHAMLAINLSTAGDYITHNSKKYYFWETTSKGWPIGMLPPESQNIDYWEIAL